MRKIIKGIYVVIGVMSLILGIIGICLPILPTTPLVLLSSICFVKGSEKINNRFKTSQFHKKYAEEFIRTRAMTLNQKVKILLVSESLIGICLIWINHLHIRLVLIGIMLIKLYYFTFRIKTIKNERVVEIEMNKKIMIIGCPGSGKSTLATQLGRITQLPVVYLDKEYWKPNWIKTDKEEWRIKQEKFIEKDLWIIDGNYNNTLEVRAKAAETIIFLDLNRWVCLSSVINRYITYRGRERLDRGNGCEETLDWQFIKWVYNYPKESRKKVIEILEEYKDKNIIIMKSRKDIKQLIISYKDTCNGIKCE